jgi:glucosylceramidase
MPSNATRARRLPFAGRTALPLILMAVAGFACGGGGKPSQSSGSGTGASSGGSGSGSGGVGGSGGTGVSSSGSGGSGSGSGGGTSSGGTGADGGGSSAVDGGSSSGSGDGGGTTIVVGNYKTAELFQTSRAGDKLADKGPLTVLAMVGTKPKIAVSSTAKQEVLGFGVSFTESAATVLKALPAATRQEVIDQYWKPTNANFTMSRMHIASCDFSLATYTYAATATTDMSNFSIQHDIDSGLIQLINDAQTAAGAAGKIRHIASPWTAPPWMKQGVTSMDPYVGGTLNPTYHSVYSLYFQKYVEAYKAQGIPIWAVTPQNEPLHSGQFDTMGMLPPQEATFVGGFLGPKMQALGVKILGYDHNKGPDLMNWANALYGDATAGKFFDGMSNHWYESTFITHEDSLESVHTTAPTKWQIAAEDGDSNFNAASSNPAMPAPTSAWKNDAWWWAPNLEDWCKASFGPSVCLIAEHPFVIPIHRLANDIITTMNHWQNAWLWWSAIVDKLGGPSHFENGVTPGTVIASPIMADMNGDKSLYYTPNFYVLEHFSKFLLPGGHVLASTVDPTLAPGANQPQTNANSPVVNAPATAYVKALAATNLDGSAAVVVFNMGTVAADYEITIGTQAIDANIPGQALQTILLKP